MEYTTYGQAGERVVLSKERLFSWNKREGEKTFATVYNNCDEIELKLNGKHPIKYPFSLLYFHCTFAFAILHELLTYFHYDTRTI
jgi:hypothetical protein